MRLETATGASGAAAREKMMAPLRARINVRSICNARNASLSSSLNAEGAFKSLKQKKAETIPLFKLNFNLNLKFTAQIKLEVVLVVSEAEGKRPRAKTCPARTAASPAL